MCLTRGVQNTYTFQRMTLNYIRRVLYATGDPNGMKNTKLTKEFCVTGQNKSIKNLCKIQKLGE